MKSSTSGFAWSDGILGIASQRHHPLQSPILRPENSLSWGKQAATVFLSNICKASFSAVNDY